MREFKLITDSCCDLSSEMIQKYNIGYLGLVCNIDGKEIVEDFGESLSYKEFYKKLSNGSMATTGQVNPQRFYDEFEKYVKDGIDVLYIGFSSALSGTYNSALMAKEELLEKYPNARIEVVDSKAASCGQGFLVYLAAKYKEQGKTIDEVKEYVMDNRKKLYHFFSVDDLKHLERGGRIGKGTAVVGNMLNIKPVLYVNEKGELKSLTKVRGKKKVVRELVRNMEENIDGNELDTVFISHSESDLVDDLCNLIKEKFKVKEIIINYIGVVIGSHTGQGTIAVYFIGKEK